MGDNLVRVGIRLRKEDLDVIDQLAAKGPLDRSDHLRVALHEYLERRRGA